MHILQAHFKKLAMAEFLLLFLLERDDVRINQEKTHQVLIIKTQSSAFVRYYKAVKCLNRARNRIDYFG